LDERELGEQDDHSLSHAGLMFELGHDVTGMIGNSSSRVMMRSRQRRGRRKALASAENFPLYAGWGTHYAWVYIGTPPQRQSVIIDTGSHYTAFPCSGCSECGEHTDGYWNMKKSKTASVPKCQNSLPCTISQVYQEGSSWEAIKVVDKLWVGGADVKRFPEASAFAMDFMFGCQTTETGLFRTQQEDGIMGMMMAEDTLPSQLVKHGLTKTSLFALCFRVGGGLLTLGGVDQRIHLASVHNSKPHIVYAKLTRTTGWYTVNLLEVIFVSSKKIKGNSKKASLNVDNKLYRQGGGVIVDSGTTDTYLPTSVESKFVSLFKEFTGGVVYTTDGSVKISSKQFEKIPDLMFVLEGTSGDPVEVIMPRASYVEDVGGGAYTLNIFFEGQSALLGASLMHMHNVIFDADNQRVGFVPSECKYEEL